VETLAGHPKPAEQHREPLEELVSFFKKHETEG
jgi:hypothetical protein